MRNVNLAVEMPEDEYRYLYALLIEHDPVSDVGRKLCDRLYGRMGETIDRLNNSVVWYLAISQSSRGGGEWGRGKTEDEAVAACRAAGARAREQTQIWEILCRTEDPPPYVAGFNIYYSGEKNLIANYLNAKRIAVTPRLVTAVAHPVNTEKV